MLKHRVWLAALLPIAAAVGCSSGPDATESGAGSGSGSGRSGGGVDPGGEVTVVESSIGPITAASGDERTQCITVRLPNSVGALVRRFRTTLRQGSHHMIVYRSTATEESPTPTPCAGLGGLLSGDHP